MVCENDLCIYQKDGKCILREISIDGRGICAEFILPNIAKDILESVKKETIEVISSSDDQREGKTS